MESKHTYSPYNTYTNHQKNQLNNIPQAKSSPKKIDLKLNKKQKLI